MIKSPRTLAVLVVIAHWIVAIVHLFFAAQIVAGPNNNVSGLAIVLLTGGHLIISIAIWKLSDKLSGLVSLLFFLATMSADLYEHFLNHAPNKVLMVAPGSWTFWFDASVFALLALEILGCFIGILLLGGRSHPAAA